MDLTEYIGRRYGYWTVVGVGEPKKYKSCSRNTLICQCICENIRTVDKSALINGRSTNCGCGGVILREGEQYNEWTVIGKSDKTNKHNNQFYTCQCSCGVIRDVRMSDLTNGASKNCGHNRMIMSRGATAIKNILDDNRINYFMEYIFEDLPRRKFDFAIHNNGTIIRLVEFDGEQHEEDSKSSWHSDDLMRRDKEKDQYAIQHNISLVRIPFWKDETVNYDDIFGKEFLIKE